MERIASTEERIRRAEEIYQRRRNQGVRLTGNTVNISNKPDISLFKKMIYKIIACIIIYVVIYLIKNSNYIFSEGFLKKTNEILSYDMNIQLMYERTIEYFKGLNINLNNEEQGKQQENQNEDNTQNTEDDNNKNEDEKNSEENNEKNNEKSSKENSQSRDNNGQTNEGDASTGGMGGGSEVIAQDTTSTTEEQKSQMKIDAQYIKNNYNIVLPLKGIVTSRFGSRTPSDIISANHAGIDIGVNEGSKIVSAIDGKVTEVSSFGDYGNHLKIVNGNVTTLYAHCKTIYIKEGDEIQKGTEIAEVGATGKATGPHLHFEIRVDDRLVNPEYVLEF